MSTVSQELAQLAQIITRMLAIRDRAHEGMLRVRYTNALDQLRYAEERLRRIQSEAKAAKA